jgi:thymidylate kinase/nitrogen regulatory protein PII-like uncharacterized protein
MLAKHIIPVFEQLEAEGYTYCVLGGELLPNSLPGSDIDIMVDKIDEKLIQIFYRFGFIKSKSVQVFLGKPVVFCLYDYADGWIPVHVTSPRLSSWQRIAPDQFATFSKERDGLKFATDELYFAVTFMQSFYKKNITEKRASRINKLWNDSLINKERCLKILRDLDGDGKLVAQKIEAQSILKIENIINENLNNKFSKMHKKIYSRAKKILKQRPRKKYGLLVSVEGIDGSGKSSFIELVNNSVPKEGRFLFLRQSMAGRGFGKYSRKIRTIWRRSCDKNDIFSIILKNGLLPLVLIIELFSLYKIYFSSFIKKKKGFNVIFDRYACLHYVRQMVNNKNDFWGKQLYIDALLLLSVKLFPTPDIFVYFDIEPAMAHERKKEDELDDLKAKSNIYRKELLPHYDKKTEVFVIDALRPKDEIVRIFLSRYWERLV